MSTAYLPQIDLDWKQIDTVFLDMDGTLLDLHFDNYFWLEHLPTRYAELQGITREQAVEYLNNHHKRTQGTLHWYCLDHWQDIIQTNIVTLKQEVAHKIQWRAEAEQFLIYLREQQKKVVLLTNAHFKSVELKFMHVPMQDHFDDVLISHTFQLPKEHELFWSTLEQHYEIDKQRSLFIDDNVRVLQTAREHGVEHLILVQQPDSTRDPNPAHPEFINLLSYTQLMGD